MHGQGGLVRTWNKGILWEAIDHGYDEDPEKLTPKQRTRDTDAFHFIIQVVKDQYLDDLKHIHCYFGILHVITVLEELVTIKKKDNKTMHEYMGKIQSWCRKLSVGTKPSLPLCSRGLPREIYEGLIRSLEYDEESLSVKMVNARLLLEESRQYLDKEQESSELKAFMS
ncbi:hypothetical protein PR048_003853 [Dryococelus australis]|uniref:Uncharacterized protein n=1 Tax=Dryococelus australis TaxID=614101 RepID=A0ABQ9IQT2_9NEOP|nr:hypothetical protein PR048_003853 [Dryococelus australis]